MATYKPLFHDTFVAGEDLSAAQYHFVKISGDNTVALCSAVTDKPIGILQDEPASGESALVMIAGISKVVAGETLTAGGLIGTAADAEAADVTAGTDTTVYSVGQVIVGAAAGAIAEVVIDCMSIARGA